MKRAMVAASIFLMFLLATCIASAHLEAGQDDEVNGYLLDFGYSPAQPRLLETTFINFNVLTPDMQQSVNVTKAWIRISKGEDVVFSGTLHPDEGNMGFLFIFPEAGNYAILAKFYIAEDIIAEKTYDIHVGSDPFINKAYYFLGAASLVVIAFALVVSASVIKRKKGKKK